MRKLKNNKSELLFSVMSTHRSLEHSHIIKSDTISSFKYPPWSGFEHGTFGGSKLKPIYYAMDEGKLMGYLIVSEAYYQFDTIPVFMEIDRLEVHPDYRRRGIATTLMNRLFQDYQENNFWLEPYDEPAILAFYAQMGFCLLFEDRGTESIYLTKLAEKPGNDLRTIVEEFNDHPAFEPSFDTDFAGCVWSSKEMRFVNYDRTTYQEEIEAVKKDPWQIRSVKHQTLELQRLAITGEPWTLQYIPKPAPEIRTQVIIADFSIAEDMLDPLTEDEKALVNSLRDKFRATKKPQLNRV